MAYTTAVAITIDHTQCGASDSSGFPMLFAGVFPKLRTAANGGQVQNSSGFDIIMSSTSALDGSGILPFEFLNYDSTTGQVEIWVKIPTLSHTADTVIYIIFNNSAITTDQSNKASVWSAYLGVWHFGSSSSLVLTDSAAGHTAVNHGATAAAGQINGGAAFASASSQWIDVGAQLGATASQISILLWAKLTTFAAYQRFAGNFNTTSGYEILVGNNAANGQWGMQSSTSPTTNATWSTANLVTGAWNHLVGVQNGSGATSQKLYANGTNVTGTQTGAVAIQAPAINFELGRYSTNIDFLNGVLDEVQVYNGVVSLDWALSAYNNQKAGSTFWSVPLLSLGPVQQTLTGSLTASGTVTKFSTLARAKVVGSLAMSATISKSLRRLLSGSLASSGNAGRPTTPLIYQDSDLQTLPGWQAHVGSNIGGVTPTSYGWRQFQPPTGKVMQFYVTGPAYADWLAGISRPLHANDGNLQLSFKMMIDTAALTHAQVLEFDTRVSVAGWNYSFGAQIDISRGGVLQISTEDGTSWVDTGFTPGIPTPNVWHTFLCEYFFNTTTRKYSYIAVTIDGHRYVIGSGLQNLDPTLLNWADTATFQIQQGTSGIGGTYNTYIDSANFIWPIGGGAQGHLLTRALAGVLSAIGAVTHVKSATTAKLLAGTLGIDGATVTGGGTGTGGNNTGPGGPPVAATFVLMINGQDYSEFVHPATEKTKITWELNKPQVLVFGLCDPTGQFTIGGIARGLPDKDSLVELNTSVFGTALFKGYVAQQSDVTLQGYDGTGPIYSFRITCTSEEYELNRMSVRLGVLPSLAGRRSGDIIRIITNYLLPGKFDMTNVDAGEFKPNFTISATDVWSDIMMTLATADRKHYWVLNGQIFFKDIGDADLGCLYDPTTDPAVTGWNTSKLTTSPQSTAIYNDYIVVGEDCAKGPAKLHSIGDGFEGNWPLQKEAYNIQEEIIVNETWEQSIDEQKWEVEDPNSAILPAQPNLQIIGGSGITSTFVRLQRAIELTGAVRAIHGEVQLTGPSSGRVGCFYKDFLSVSDTNQICGWSLTKNGLQTDIQPMLGGINITDETGSIAQLEIVATPDNNSPPNYSYALNIYTYDPNTFFEEQQVTFNNVAGATFLNGQTLQVSGRPTTASGGATVQFDITQQIAAFPSWPKTLALTNDSGVVSGPRKITTQDNHSYVLITRLYSPKSGAYNNKYFAPNDPAYFYGGDYSASLLFISFELWDYAVAAVANLEPTIIKIATLSYDISALQTPFLSYVVVQADDLRLAINYTEIAYPMQASLKSEKPVYNEDGVPVSWFLPDQKTIGFGIDRADATITNDSSGTSQLQWYPDTITTTDTSKTPNITTTTTQLPVAGEKVELNYQFTGKATGRVRNNANVAIVAAKYGNPDDGVRTMLNTQVTPPIRSDEDAYNAAAALLTDAVVQQYQGTYNLYGMFCTVRPMPGRYLVINDPKRFDPSSPMKFIVTKVEQIVEGDIFTMKDFHDITLTFGPYLTFDFLQEKLLAAQDVNQVQGAATEALKTLDILSLPLSFIQAAIEDWDIDIVYSGNPWGDAASYSPGIFRFTVTHPVHAYLQGVSVLNGTAAPGSQTNTSVVVAAVSGGVEVAISKEFNISSTTGVDVVLPIDGRVDTWRIYFGPQLQSTPFINENQYQQYSEATMASIPGRRVTIGGISAQPGAISTIPADCGIEVRRSDRGWGLIDPNGVGGIADPGLIYRGPLGQNYGYITRASRNTLFYMRLYRGLGQVTANKAVSLLLTPATVLLSSGQTQQLNVAAFFTDGTSADVTSSVQWTSSNNGAASVNAAGLLTAHTDGPLQVTITAFYGGISTDMTAQLTPPQATVVRIDIAPSETYALWQQDAVEGFKATGVLSDNSVIDLTGVVAWQSSNPAIGTISAAGLGHCVAYGVTTITCTYAGMSSSNSALLYCGAQNPIVGIQWTSPQVSPIDGVTPLRLSLLAGSGASLDARLVYKDGTTGPSLKPAVYRPTTHYSGADGGGCVNPQNVYDGNESTFGAMTVTPYTSDTGDSFYGFPSVVLASNAYLRILSSCGANESAACSMRYSLDGGATYHDVYIVYGSNRPLTLDSILLPAGTNAANVRVRGECHPGNGNSSQMSIYEIFIETSGGLSLTCTNPAELVGWSLVISGNPALIGTTGTVILSYNTGEHSIPDNGPLKGQYPIGVIENAIYFDVTG